MGKKRNVNQLRPFPDGLSFACVLRACLYQAHSGCCPCQPTASAFLLFPYTSWSWPEIQPISCTEWSFLLGISAYVASCMGPIFTRTPTLGSGSQHHASFCSWLSPYPGHSYDPISVLARNYPVYPYLALCHITSAALGLC